VIINGRSSAWIDHSVETVLRNNCLPVLMAANNSQSKHHVSSVGFDFYGIYTSWCEYVLIQGWRNMALLGVNRDTAGDMLKCEAFMDYNSRHNKENRYDVYYIESSLEECCKRFLEKAGEYDAVLCTNDLISIILVTLIRKQVINDNLQIYAFWDSPLSEYIRPKVKTISLDYAELGRQAIKVSSFLAKNPNIAVLSVTVCGQTEMTERKICSIKSENAGDTFLKDRRAQEIYSLENLFSSIDSNDMQIICGIIDGISYERLAEKLSISIGAIKYRVKRMLTIAQRKDRNEFVNLIQEYFSMDNAAQCLEMV